MAAQSLLAKLGMRLGTLGTVASLAIAAPLSEGDPSMAAHTAASRIGQYFDRTAGAEKAATVVMGAESFSVRVDHINILQGVVPSALTNGDVWITSAGMFCRAGGATMGPFGGGITGTLTSGRVPFANGTSSLTDNAIMTFSAGAGLSVNKAGTARSEMFGASAGNGTLTGTDNTLVGTSAGNALTTGATNTIVGARAGVAIQNGSFNVCIGSGAGQGLTSGGSNTIVGSNSSTLTTGSYNIILGAGKVPTSGTSNTFIAGGNTTVDSITAVYFGTGPQSGTPAAYLIGGSGGLGTDIPGAAVTFAGGIGTGTGVGGNLIMQVAPAGSTGTTPNALVTGLTINQRKTVDYAFGSVYPVRTTATTDTALFTDYLILANTTAGSYTQTLPASPPTGLVIVVKKTVAANTLTISGGVFNIDGAANVTVTTQYQSYTFMFNGSEWSIL